MNQNTKPQAGVLPSTLLIEADEPNAVRRALNNAYWLIADRSDNEHAQDAVANCVLHELLDALASGASQQAAPEPVEMRADFTDTARAALMWVLWHHQGGSSTVGQPIRFALGMGQHEYMNESQIAEAKRWAALPASERDAAPQAAPVDPAPSTPTVLYSAEIWAAAQLAPGEGIEDGITRIDQLIATAGGGGVDPVQPEPVAWQMRTRFQDREWSRWSECADHCGESLEMVTGTLTMQFRPLYATPPAAQGAEPVRCLLCRYQHGHTIGCDNNPLDIALRAQGAEPLCACKDRPASMCPGEWEPGCDLGANQKFVRVGAQGAERAALTEPTDAMVTAYLKANDAYWRQADQLLIAHRDPGKWRQGTPREATLVSLRAALAASMGGGEA